MALIDSCLTHFEEADIYPALLIQLLHLLDIDELLGLNVGHWMREHAGEVSWLEVMQVYRQHRTGVPELSQLLDSANAYRRIVCTTQAEWMLARHVLMRLEAGAGEKDPMFLGANGERLTPAEYKMGRDQLLAEMIKMTDQDRELLLGQTGSKYKKQSAYYRGDLIRATGEYYCRKAAGLDDAKVAAMLGIDRRSTYARHYVDWANPELMIANKQQLEQWHHQMLAMDKDGTLRCGKPGLRQHGRVYRLRCPAGATLDLYAVGGLTITVERK